MKGIDKRLVVMIALIIVGLVVVFGVAYYALPRVLVTFSRAENSGKLVLGNTMIVGTKILAKADGIDKCVVNVFVVDESGKGAVGRSVRLDGDVAQIAPAVVQTDAVGKATFNITSSIENQFILKPIVDGIEVAKELTVTFRN